MHAEPFVATIADDAIADLRDRLSRTRWPEDETTVGTWDQGVPLAYARELCRSWAEDYDFGFVERLNRFEQIRATVAGGGDEPLGIHAIHVRSPEPDAVPLLLTHGWPGSVLEFLAVIGPLADPKAHGGDPADAFHVVAPALPGYGFSDKPRRTGWGVPRIAAAWDELMTGLGYDRYGAQGGDWGAIVTAAIARRTPDHLVGIHVNMATAPPDRETMDDLTDFERAALDRLTDHGKTGTGYSKQQSTRPQTLGYGLTDSPAGQATWIAEKFREWTDNDGHPEDAVTRQQILDDVSMYWFTASAASSARLYWESFGERDGSAVEVPSGVSNFPAEIVRPSRRWIERVFTDLRWYEEMSRGGHFAALEEPDLFVDQVRSFFRLVR